VRRTGQNVLREARGVSRTDTVGKLAESVMRAVAAGTLRRTMDEVQARRSSGVVWKWVEEGTAVRAQFRLGDVLEDAEVVVSQRLDAGTGEMVSEVRVGDKKTERRFGGGESVGAVADGTASMLEKLVRED